MRGIAAALGMVCVAASAGCQAPVLLGGPAFREANFMTGGPYSSAPDAVGPSAAAKAGLVADVKTELTSGPGEVTVRDVLPVADADLAASWEGWCVKKCRSGGAAWDDATRGTFLATYSMSKPFKVPRGQELHLAFWLRVNTQRGLDLIQTRCLYLRSLKLVLDDGSTYSIAHAPLPPPGVAALLELYGDQSSKSFQNCPDVHGKYPAERGPHYTPRPTPT